MNSEDYERLKNQIDFLRVLVKAAQEWRAVAECCANSADPEEAQDRIAALLNVDTSHAAAVLDSQFRALTVAYVRRMTEQLAELEATLAGG